MYTIYVYFFYYYPCLLLQIYRKATSGNKYSVRSLRVHLQIVCRKIHSSAITKLFLCYHPCAQYKPKHSPKTAPGKKIVPNPEN